MQRAKLSTSATLTCTALRPTLALTVLAGVAFKAKGGLTSGCSRIATAAIVNHSLLAVSVVSGSHLASPQAPKLKC
jgi:hypothetical protein